MYYRQIMNNIFAQSPSKTWEELREKLDQIENKLQHTHQYSNLCNLYYNKAAILFSFGRSTEALHLLLDQRDLFNRFAQPVDQLRINLATVVILDALGYHENYYENMVAFHARAQSLKVHPIVADTLNNIGDHFVQNDKMEDAIITFQACLDYCETHFKQSNLYPKAYYFALLNQTEMFIRINQLQKVKTNFEIFQKTKENADFTHLLMYDHCQFLFAVAKQDVKHAAQLAEQLQNVDLESLQLQIVEDIFQSLLHFYELQGQVERAIQIMERHIAYQKSLSSAKVHQLFITSQYEMKKAVAMNDMYFDSLTQTWNRNGFEKTVIPMLETGCPNASTLFGIIDVDYFKEINDRYGHVIGDAVLMEISNRIHRFYMEYDDNSYCYYGRFGGDEFYFVYQNEDEHHLQQFARLFYEQLIAEPFTYETISFPLRMTIGCAYGKNDIKKSLNDWISLSDSILYEAKKNGRQQILIKKID